MLMCLLRRFPPETSHRIAIWSLKTGFWRVAMVMDAIITLIWTTPLVFLVVRPMRHIGLLTKNKEEGAE